VAAYHSPERSADAKCRQQEGSELAIVVKQLCGCPRSDPGHAVTPLARILAVSPLRGAGPESPRDAVTIALPSMRDRTDEDLRRCTDSLRLRIAAGEEEGDYLPEALGVVYEVARRALDRPMAPAPLAAGMAISSGGIAQLRDGEGKGLAAILAAYLAVLRGLTVHVVTLDEYLAARDFERAQAVLGRLSVDTRLVCDRGLLGERRTEYGDVTYGSFVRFAGDYLADNLARRPVASGGEGIGGVPADGRG
jgi:hypothetical protein